MLRRMLVIALGALIVSACSSSREAAVSSFRVLDSRVTKDSVKVEKVVVEVHDTIMETTTITIREAENGDTLRVSRVTDRDRSRSMMDLRRQKDEVKVVRDTVFIEKRDSVSTTTNGSAGSPRVSPVVLTLKWVFWIIIGLIALVIVVRIRGRP